MRFSTILCSLLCSTSLALSITKRDETVGMAPIEAREEPAAVAIEVRDKPTKVVNAPSTYSNCAATLRPTLGDNCGVVGSVLSPRSVPYSMSGMTLTSCTNACVCGMTRFGCKAFAFEAGNCTLYGQTLTKMGYEGGSATLYDRSCYKRALPPVQTMGALEHKVRKRAGVDDFLVGALMGI